MTARHCARRSATAATLRCRHPPRGGATLEESDNERVIARRLKDATTTKKKKERKKQQGRLSLLADKTVSPLVRLRLIHHIHSVKFSKKEY